jgi:hypothetical protein
MGEPSKAIAKERDIVGAEIPVVQKEVTHRRLPVGTGPCMQPPVHRAVGLTAFCATLNSGAHYHAHRHRSEADAARRLTLLTYKCHSLIIPVYVLSDAQYRARISPTQHTFPSTRSSDFSTGHSTYYGRIWNIPCVHSGRRLRSLHSPSRPNAQRLVRHGIAGRALRSRWFCVASAARVLGTHPSSK